MKLIILAFPLYFFQGYFEKRFLCFISLVLAPFKFEAFPSLCESAVIVCPAGRGEGEQRKLHLLFLSLTHSEVWLTALFGKEGAYFMEGTWFPLGPVLKLHLV